MTDTEAAAIIRTEILVDGWHATLNGELVAIRSDRGAAEGEAVKVVQQRGEFYRVVSW